MSFPACVSRLALPAFLLLGLTCAAPAARGQFDIVHAFAGGTGDGKSPYWNSGVVASGSTLYGMTWMGGSADSGVLFKVSGNGSGYQVLHHFAGYSFINPGGSKLDGSGPMGTPALGGTTLYGMTNFGGENGFGTIFKVETNGSGFQLLHSFGATNDGTLPVGSLLLADDVLYGLTPTGGSNSAVGTLFSIHTDGSGYVKLHDFDVSANGIVSPQSSLTLSGTTLYGTTALGGSVGGGGVFRIETNGTGYQLLHDCVGGGTDGYKPYGPVTVDGTTLYATTSAGGANGFGTVFRMDTSGANVDILYDFTVTSYAPYSGLVLDGTTLYGMNHSGDTTGGAGCVFGIGTDGTGFQNLHPFKFPVTLADGAIPFGSPLLVDGTLYGMTNLGGSAANGGCVFALDLDGDGGGGGGGGGGSTAGALRFSTPTYKGKEGTATVTITVTREDGTDGTVTVDCDSSNGTAAAGADFLEVDQTLVFLPGVKKLTFPVSVLNDGDVELPEDLTLTLANPTGGATLVPLADTAQVEISDDDKENVISVSDLDGDTLTFKLGGPGQMDVTAASGAAPGDATDVGGGGLVIALTGTTSASSLTIKAKAGEAGDGSAIIASITGDGDLKSLTAKGMDVSAPGIVLDGWLGKVTIRDLLGGATITAGGADTQKTAITAHVLADDSSLSLGSSLQKLAAARIEACDISAPGAGALAVKGDKKLGLAGDFSAALILSGAGVVPGKPALAKLTVAGAITGAVIAVNGPIGTVAAGQLHSSRVFAGFSPADDADPLAGGTFTPGLLIKSVAVKGKESGFQDSTIAAAQVGAVKLASVVTDNGGVAFGVLFDETLGSVKLTEPKFTWSAEGGADQGVGDFHVKQP